MASFKQDILLEIRSKLESRGLKTALKFTKALEKQLLTVRGAAARGANKFDEFALRTQISENKRVQAVRKANRALRQQGTHVDQLKKQMSSWGGVMSATLPQLQAWEKSGKKINNRMANTAMTVRQATHGLKGFRMELLGVMFFGQMVMGFFTGLIRPAMEAFGVFELWTDMLTLLFLPIMQEIFPYMLSFMTWMMDLPAPVKLAMGAVALLGIALGGLLFFIGSVGLGIGSLIIAFGSLPASIATFTLAMSGAGLAVGRLLIALLTLNGTAIVRELALMSAGITKLASTTLGAAAIIGLAFLAAFKISSDGLKNLGKEYTSIWAGIAGTAVDAIVGIGVLFLGLGGVAKTVIDIIWQSFKSLFKALAAAFQAALSGEDISDAFMRGFKKIDYAKILQENLVPAGVVATSATAIKDKLGLIRDIPNADMGSTSQFAPTQTTATTPQKIEVNNTNNINVMDKLEFQRMMDENNNKLMDDLRRLSTL